VAQSFALRSVLPRPGALRALHGFARFTRRIGLYGLARRTGLLSWLGTLGALAEQGGPPPDRTVYQMLGDLPDPAQPVRGTVAMLVCCLSNLTAPRPPTQPSASCSHRATTFMSRNWGAAVCPRARSATATPWWTWRSRTAPC